MSPSATEEPTGPIEGLAAGGLAAAEPEVSAPPVPGQPGSLARSVAELQELLLETEGIEEFLHGLAALAGRLVGTGLSCGLALQPDGRPLTAACSDDVASQIDEMQFVIGEGPCLEALRERRPARVEDTHAGGAWAAFTGQAAAYGIRSCLSLPLVANDATIGALNLYSRVPGAFGAGQLRRAEEFARCASAALAVASRLAGYASLTGQLRESLATRAVIDQAIGVLMGQERCTQAEAFAVLRSASQRRNVKLREIASQIVTSVSGQAPQPPPFAGG